MNEEVESQSTDNRKKYILKQVFNTVLFLIGVISCYQGALRNIPWLGFLVVLVIGFIHFIPAKQKIQELKLIGILLVLSFILETILISTGVYAIEANTRIIFPTTLISLWIFSLWLNFIFRVKDYLDFMNHKPILAFIVGAVFAFLIFNSASRMGLVFLNFGKMSLLICALAWGIYLPIIFYIADKFLNKENNN